MLFKLRRDSCLCCLSGLKFLVESGKSKRTVLFLVVHKVWQNACERSIKLLIDKKETQFEAMRERHPYFMQRSFNELARIFLTKLGLSNRLQTLGLLFSSKWNETIFLSFLSCGMMFWASVSPYDASKAPVCSTPHKIQTRKIHQKCIHSKSTVSGQETKWAMEYYFWV